MGLASRRKITVGLLAINDEAVQAVERTNELLDEVERLREEWERSKETIESVNQMRIVADGYIQSLQEANQSLGQCVEGLIDEVDRIQAVNEEILRTAEAMAKISKNMD